MLAHFVSIRHSLGLLMAAMLVFQTPMGGLQVMAAIETTVTQGPPLPISTASHVGGLVKGTPVVAGGSHWSEDKKTKRWLHECFVLRDGKWVEGPDLPQPLADAAYASDGQSLFVAGGSDGKTATQRVLRLSDPSDSARWEELPDLPLPIEAAAGVVAGGNFYVVGGVAVGKPSSRAFALSINNPASGWKEVTAFPADGRSYSALVAVDLELLLFGGIVLPPLKEKPQIFSDILKYDIAGDRWTKLEAPPIPGYAWTAHAIDSDQILIAGRVSVVGEVNDELFCFNLQTRQLSSIGHRQGGCCTPIIKTGENEFFITGGEPDTNRTRSVLTAYVKVRQTKDQ